MFIRFDTKYCEHFHTAFWENTFLQPNLDFGLVGVIELVHSLLVLFLSTRNGLSESRDDKGFFKIDERAISVDTLVLG